MSSARTIVTETLAAAGITVNGSNPGDILIHDKRFFDRVLSGGLLALGESYMDGWWSCDRLDVFTDKAMRADISSHIPRSLNTAFHYLKSRFLNRQSKKKAFEVGEKHYDKGNDLYESFLDPFMTYSCGFWHNTRSLNKAQTNKLDLICRKLGLKKGMRVLDIGCGWGSFAKFAAQNYGVSVVGVTISKEQAEYARTVCASLPVDIRLMDYRELDEEFDRIASIGMFEHVGVKNYGTYMEVAARCLKSDGLFVLHTIGTNVSQVATNAWTDKYIFPNGMVPSTSQMGSAIEGHFVLEDWHSFGAYYDKTLVAWHKRFVKNWDSIKDQYDERFFRMWEFYLLTSAGSFRARSLQLWQLVLSPQGVNGVYSRVCK